MNPISSSSTAADHAAEIDAGNRFAFGANWARFLEVLNERRILAAEKSLCDMLGVTRLDGKRFLDIGSGSGLFSLAARRLGATVHSFDYDPDSVACTQELRKRYFQGDDQWRVEQASVLDDAFMQSLGTADIVYSWGVLHHTGSMWRALANAADRAGPGSKLFIAIYNDQGRASRMWLTTKRAYNKLPGALRWLVLWPATLYLWGPATLRDILQGKPGQTWHAYTESNTRGMSPWRDVVDWVGGLPFEVARPEEIFDFYRNRGFSLQQLRTCAGGVGCNEFVFTRV